MSEAKISEAVAVAAGISQYGVLECHLLPGGLEQLQATGGDAKLYLHPQPAELAEQQGDALLPCPFCGESADRIDFGPGAGDNEGGSCVACTGCGSSGPVEFGFKENFRSIWNRRALAATGKQQVGEVPSGMVLIQISDAKALCAYVTHSPRSALAARRVEKLIGEGDSRTGDA